MGPSRVPASVGRCQREGGPRLQRDREPLASATASLQAGHRGVTQLPGREAGRQLGAYCVQVSIDDDDDDASLVPH